MTYSKFIKTVKFFFLGISIVMLALIVINNRQNQVKIPESKFTSSQRFDSSVSQVLIEPVFVGLNNKEKPFKVSASKATRYKETSDIFYLENHF